jgi:hypothetical protein
MKYYTSSDIVRSSHGHKLGWTGAKGAREIFQSFFLLWPKKYFCGFTRFRKF